MEGYLEQWLDSMDLSEINSGIEAFFPGLQRRFVGRSDGYAGTFFEYPDLGDCFRIIC